MTSSLTKPLLACLISFKCLLGTLLMTPEEVVDQLPANASLENDSPPIIIAKEEEEISDFNDFLKLIQEKGLGLLTILEAGALYVLWNVVKDTKSREEILEKIFNSWSNDEERVRAFGKLFRLLGVSCLGLHKVGLDEIKTHLKQNQTVIMLYENNNDLIFLDVKDISDNGFVGQDGTITPFKEVENRNLYDILVFIGDVDLSQTICKLKGACTIIKNQSDGSDLAQL